MPELTLKELRQVIREVVSEETIKNKWKTSVLRPRPVVTDQEVVWVDGPHSKAHIDHHPYRVWTLYNELDPRHKPKLPIQPKHNVNAFMEDYLHDWRYRDGYLHYFSRVVDQGVWLLIEYAENNPYDKVP